jgi:para-nitrobenzyl esterase
MTEPLVVATPSGHLQGTRRPDGGALFAGIPFAAPPVGEYRFRPPQAVPGWSGVRDATRFAPPPLQSYFPDGSEDCLYLNVWTPDPTGRRPVVVWIYGGGFELGSASPPMTDAAAFSRRADVVVVAANYRVGALGFLCGPGVANLGVQDQVAALRWVRRSIGAFGGDPERVTVMGESAGAFCIGAMFGIPGASTLFDQAILQSGSTGRVFAPDSAWLIAADLCAAVGVPGVDELRVVSGDRILAVQSDVIDSDVGLRNLPGGRSWGVVLDGEAVTEDPQAAVERGEVAGVPLLITTTTEEARLFEVLLPTTYPPADQDALLAEMRRAGIVDAEARLAGYRQALPAAPLARLRSAFLTDAIYRWPAERLARGQAAAGGRAYLAQFAAQPYGPDFGACHASDLPYVFDVLGDNDRGNISVPDEPEHRAIRDQVIGAWSRFAWSGDPGWPEYGTGVSGACHQFGGHGLSHDTVGT